MRRQGSPPRSLPQSGPGSASASGASLDALFDPGSITVVGASSDVSKWGHTLSRRALESSGDRPVMLVNRRGAEVLGRRTHRTLGEAREQLDGPLDLVVVCVPAQEMVQTVADAVGAGARSLVVITAGLSELGAEGAFAEQEAVRLARTSGAVLVGPNCLGVVDTSTQLQLSHDLLPAGPVAVLSQSGNVVLDLAALLQDRGLGVSRFVSLGNQADLTVVDLMVSCLHHDDTRAVAIYAEDVVAGRAFVSAARALRAAGKPVVLMAPGRSEAAVRSAVSHTGSLTSAYQVVDAACAAAGARRVDNPTQMADLLEGLLAGRRMRGHDAAILTDGGGHGAIAGDALAVAGLESPVLSESTRALLRGQLRQISTVSNPVDLAGAGEQDPVTYVRALTTLLAADEVDGVIVTGYFGTYSTQTSALAALEIAAARAMAELVAGQPKPVVVHSIHPGGPTGMLLRSAGIPVHRDIDRACAVLAGLEEHPLPSYDEEPEVAPPITDSSYDVAKGLFTDAGIAFPVGRTIRSRDELRGAMDATGFPLVLKALGQVHKSDAGGVVLGLPDEPTAVAAYDDLVTRLSPPAVSVEALADLGQGVELIVGCVRERTFGPVVMVGIGGIHAEVLADTACALAPIGVEQARRMVLSLRGASLLTGVRGSTPVDLDALAEAVSAVSRVAARHPELAELEINPLLARPDGALALDARLVLG